jgi:MYXO-CTERM domain-containing protein
MNRRSIGQVTLTAILVVAAVGAASPRAHACGGLFCDRPPVNPLDPLPVAQSGENVVFSVTGDATQGTSVVTVHIQVLYSGAASQFSWVVPVMAVPELSTGTDRLFSSLAGVTRPTFLASSIADGTCLPSPYVNSVDGAADAAFGAGGSAGTGGPGGVTVVFQGAVGPYAAVVLQSTDSSELKTWLTSNGYYLDPHAGQIIDTYVQEGKYFVALKLLNGQDVRAIRPLVMTFHGTDPCVPLRLTAIAAFPDMPVTVYMLGRARAVPLGFYELKLDDLRIDWVTNGSNYASLLAEAANEAGGNAFVTEFAGAATIASGLLWASDRYSETALRAATTPTAYVQALVSQGLANDAQTLPLLIQYIPMPPAAIAAGIAPATFYGNLSLYSTQYTLPPFDLATLTDHVVADIIEPRRVAQQMIDGQPYLTRLGTYISPEEMNQDPLFAFNPDLPDVSATHVATLRYLCGDQKYSFCNAPVRLELADGRMAWLRNGVVAPTCQFPPFDSSLKTLPATELVWKRGPSGEGARQIDNVAAIQTALNAHNAAFTGNGPLPTGVGGAGGGGVGGVGGSGGQGGLPADRVAPRSGCGCAMGGDSGARPVLGSVAGLALAALLGRRRRRAIARSAPLRRGCRPACRPD